MLEVVQEFLHLLLTFLASSANDLATDIKKNKISLQVRLEELSFISVFM